MNCEYCGSPAEFVDCVIDLPNCEQGRTAYRDRPLCRMHAREAKEHNTARVRKITDPNGRVFYRDDPLPDPEEA